MLIDHLDVRVSSLAGSRPLYDALLGALGFSKIDPFDDGVAYYHPSKDPDFPFFSLLLDESHHANETRTAFAARTRADVDRIAAIAHRSGARNFEPPALCPEYSERYYASFFEDADGNKLEVCCRKAES